MTNNNSMPSLSADAIQAASLKLSQARSALFVAGNIAIQATSHLKSTEARLTANGLEGKNVAERNANLVAATAQERSNQESAEEGRRAAQHACDLAEIEYNCIKLQLRLLEAM